MRKRRNQWISLMLCVCLAAGMIGGWIVEGKSLIAEAAQETAGVSEEIVEEAGQTETNGDSALIREEELAEEPSGEEKTSESETSEAESSSAGESAAEAESSSEKESTSEIESSSEAEETTEEEGLSGTESSPEGESSSETESTAEAEETTEEEGLSGTESSPEGESSSETESTAEAEETTEEEDLSGTESSSETESLTETEASAEESSTEAESETEEATETEEESAQGETEEENGLEEIAGDPSAQAGGETAWNMSDPGFDSSIEILDEDGNQVTQEQMVPGKKYTIRLHFSVKDGSEKFFRGATRVELEEAGLTEADLEGINDGEWLYVPLGADVTAELGDNTQLPDNVKVVQDGKGLLVKYEKVQSNDKWMDDVEVTFTGTLSENADVSGLDIVGGDGTANYVPEHSNEPVLKKVAEKYDPETHRITYKVTILNPTDEPMEGGFLFEDSVSVPGLEGTYPEYVKDSLKVGENAIEGDVSYDENSRKLSFTYSETIEPGGSVEIEYQLDVTEFLNQFPEALGSFLVDNKATASPPEGQKWTPMTDKDEEQVFFGTLEKSGWIRETSDTDFWGYKDPFEWVIEAYDPYLTLYDTTFTDTLPEGITYEDIIGVLFKYIDENGQSQQKAFVYKNNAWDPADILQYMKKGEGNTVTFDFSDAPDELKKQLFQSEGHRLKMHILTKNEKKEGTYTNKVEAQLPSETQPREDDATVNYGPSGVHAVKEGEIIDGGDQLRYTVTVDVNDNIEEGKPEAYGIIAGLIDQMHVTYAPEDNGYIDTSQAIDVESVVAKYTEDGEEKVWEFSKDGEDGHRFGVYAVSELGTQEEGALKDNEGKSPYTNSTAIVLNPEVKRVEAPDEPPYYLYPYNKVYGKWPDALKEKQVTLTYTYTIDPKLALFVDSTNNHTSYHGARTLAEYISLMGDIIVYNYALAGINDSQSNDDEKLNLVSPLTKQGDVKVDLANDKKIITYTVTFQNGENNDSALPKDAADIFFVDNYDEKLSYVPGTLKATRKMPDGRTWDFLYHGPEDWQDHTIRASWNDFQGSVYGTTLAQDFVKQNGRYTYVFTYDMEAGPQMPQNAADVAVENVATVEYTNSSGEPGSLNHVTSHNDFPTGALTKQATLEETGKVSFYIEINANEENLSEDTEYLQIEDEADEVDGQYLKLEGDLIRVEKYDKESGGWKELTLSDYTWNGESDTTWSGSDTWMKRLYPDSPNKFTLRVPDQTHLRIHYAYGLTEEGKTQGNVSISNSVKVQGFEALTDETKTTFPTSSIMGTVFSHFASIPISKNRQGTEDPVPDVRFVLYVPNTHEEIHDDAIEEAKNAGRETLKYEGESRELKPVQVRRTGEDGQATMDWDFLRADDTTVYGIVETYTPSEYVKLENPIFLKIKRNKTLEILNIDQLNNQVSLSEDGKTLKIANPIVPPPGAGNLSVTKSVTGEAGDKTRDWHFRVELSDKTVTGTYGDMAFTNGTAEFTLKDGQTKTATGLPPGITYKVTEEEANQDGYVTTSVGETGTIPETEVAHVQFQNSKPDNLLQEPQPPQELLIVPETGDPSHLLFWLALFACSLLGLTMIRRKIR